MPCRAAQPDSVAAGRQLLGEIGQDDVRGRAGQLLAELAASETAS